METNGDIPEPCLTSGHSVSFSDLGLTFVSNAFYINLSG